MKRIAEWTVYVVGGLAIVYLALYAYAAFTRRDLRPGDPIRIFRKQGAPRYSAVRSRCHPPTRGEGSQAITPSRRRPDGRCCPPA
ncbi:MAG TPA: hypothetical protein VHC94_01275 [Nitrobacter sp.]|nr:hypothetical protein [Nitrobacter sp.]